MDDQDALKARIAEAIKKADFYPIAEGWTEGSFSSRLSPFLGLCFEWSEEAAKVLKNAGLEVLLVCEKDAIDPAPHHVFLMVRDAQSGSVVYYDPTAEQYGMFGAHRRAYTRQEIEAENEMHGTRWLDSPIPYKDGRVDLSWQFRQRDFRELQQKWGSELWLPATFKGPPIDPAEASSCFKR